MQTFRFSRLLVLLAAMGTVLVSFQAAPEDIDLFSVDEANTVDKPNVLFVLDNSANWSRQSQQWPGGLTQGQSEARAIKTVINELQDSSINVGLLEYSTDGNANTNDGGFVRYHIRPMNAANKASLSGRLDTIFNNINSPTEKRSSGNPFGTLFYDVYNYLGGFTQSQNGAGTPSSIAHAPAYETAYSRFRSPLTSADSCRRTIVIFIGNNVQSGPTADSAANTAALTAVGGNTAQIPFANYTVQSAPATAPLGYSAACYSSAANCSTAENTQACRDGGFTSCSCDATDSVACSANHYSVVGVRTSSTTTTLSDTTEGPTAGVYTNDNVLACKNANQVGSYSCPATSTTSTFSGTQTTTTSTSWANCAYVDVGATGCNGQKRNYEPRGTRTRRTVVTETSTTTTRTPLGETAACYTSVSGCSTAGFNCSAYNMGCVCDTPGSTSGCGASGSQKYQIVGNFTTTVATPTGTFSPPPSGPFNADEWARFLRQSGVPIPDSTLRSQVTTYTVDVFNAQQNATQSALLFNMARVGGGKYYQAKNEDAIIEALRNIFAEVQAVNSAFSSASLPVNATNRAQNENQVFIGVFKPDRLKAPRWYGNLKRYQLIRQNGIVDLGDSTGASAINLQTGFLGDCAVSYWTKDTGNYWGQVITDDPDALGICATNTTDDHSDLPDGPFVEKGGAAGMLRHGNNPAAVADANGNFALSRNLKTLSSGSLADFTAASSGLASSLVNFIRGEDTEDEDLDNSTPMPPRALTEPRASIHGDVVHSRPQPVNYGGTTGVVVYYGANDGTYRAVQSSTGVELWSFVAPEHFSKLSRLKANTPLIKYFGDAAPATNKDYYFDGSTGLLQNADNSKIIIYPTMRRGGRKVYAFNVTNPTSPTYVWSKGCPNLTNDTGCDTGFSGIGETWSIPSVAYIAGYGSGTQPVIIMGGGYDKCEEDNVRTPSCGAAKGRGVYVLDANTGALVKHFDLGATFGARSVPADMALIDINNDSKVDYAYAVDAGGNMFRLSFIDGPTTRVPLASTAWTARRISYTSGSYRKFLFPPALLQNGNTVYLAIGSGDREHPLARNYPFPNPLDPSTGVLNRFYVFKDDLTAAASTPAFSLDDTTVMHDYTTDQGCDLSTRVLPGSAEKGWFMNLNQYGDGEQTVTSAVIAAGFAIFSTNRPTPGAAEECTTSLGEARGYFVNLLNGSGAIGTTEACGGERSGTFVGGGLPPSPVLATVPIGEGDDVRQTTVVIGAIQRDGTTSSIIGAQKVRPTIASERRPVYWFKRGDQH